MGGAPPPCGGARSAATSQACLQQTPAQRVDACRLACCFCPPHVAPRSTCRPRPLLPTAAGSRGGGGAAERGPHLHHHRRKPLQVLQRRVTRPAGRSAAGAGAAASAASRCGALCCVCPLPCAIPCTVFLVAAAQKNVSPKFPAASLSLPPLTLPLLLCTSTARDMQVMHPTEAALCRRVLAGSQSTLGCAAAG